MCTLLASLENDSYNYFMYAVESSITLGEITPSERRDYGESPQLCIYETLCIYEIIKNAPIQTHLDIDQTRTLLPFSQDSTGYICGPKIPKRTWSEVGNVISQKEKEIMTVVPGSKFITLRLDGKNFSSTLRRLRQLGVFSRGFSTDFSSVMISTMKHLCGKFSNIIYAFTQSDEITLIIGATSVIDYVQQPHEFNGRHDKLLTYGAGLASQYALKLIIQKILRDETVKLMEMEKSVDDPSSEISNNGIFSKMQSVSANVLSLPDR